MDGQYSTYFDLEQGVAQGCPLSPILFIIFMNDLQDILHQGCGADGIKVNPDQRPFVSSSFADDTFGLSNTTAKMQKVINTMQQHSEDWCWDANVLKSHILLINCDDEPGAQFTWKNADIPIRTETKNLGLWITNDLTWNKHIKAAKSKGHFALKKYWSYCTKGNH